MKPSGQELPVGPSLLSGPPAPAMKSMFSQLAAQQTFLTRSQRGLIATNALSERPVGASCMLCPRKLLRSFALFPPRTWCLDISFETSETESTHAMVSDRWSTSSEILMISETKATSGFQSEEIGWADLHFEVIVTAIAEFDSNKIRSEFHPRGRASWQF